jgi:hypothetical protein
MKAVSMSGHFTENAKWTTQRVAKRPRIDAAVFWRHVAESRDTLPFDCKSASRLENWVSLDYYDYFAAGFLLRKVFED